MKNLPALASALEDATAIYAVPEVIIDWNLNRYVPVTATNTPSENTDGFDIEIFPIESIVEPMRPTKGINKARVGSATIGDNYDANNAVKTNGRFYLADVDDSYKYWTSPYPSDSSTGALTSCAPQILYDTPVESNKIVVTFENTWASPANFSIQITSNGSSWTEIANQASLGSSWKSSGQIILYYNGSDWINNSRTESTALIQGIKVVVTSLEGGYQPTTDGSLVQTTYADYAGGSLVTYNTNGRDARLDLIEISARLEVDLSANVITVDDTFELGDSSQLHPIGTVTSNQGNITLSNLYVDNGEWVPGLFNQENLDSPYHNYVDANAEVTVSYKYENINGASLGTVQQFKMYTDSWNGQDTETVSVDLSDYSKFFNDQIMHSAMWEELTVSEIIARILDSIGFVNYNIDRDEDIQTDHIIPVFYTTGEESVWEVLSDLAEASQTAIYFDAYGVLQVKTRRFALSDSDAAVWNFTAVSDSNKLADIVSLNQDGEFEPNYYKVVYQKTNWTGDNRAGQPALQKVWEPEGTEVLRSTPLFSTLDVADNYLDVGSDAVRFWPYEGLVTVGGEIIRYKGKRYVYYTGTNGETRNTKDITSPSEFNRRNSETPWNYRHKNHFTGGLKITEREVWNSEKKRHPVDAEGYSVRHVVNGTSRSDVAGFEHKKHHSKVVLNTPKRFEDYKDILVATRGATDDTPFYHYGIKFKFVKGDGAPHQNAGIVIHNNGSNEDGYYIEFTPSSRLDGKDRKGRNELIFYSRTGGKDTRIGGDGRALAIAEDIEYEVDVTYINVPNSTDHKIQVWVNGKSCLNETISGANRNAANGKFGLFARGKTKVEYEYLYAVKRQDPEPADDFSFLDKVRGGYVGQAWEREWVFKWRTYRRRVKKKQTKEKMRWNQMFFDDFGPYVHEIREYDVKFDPTPVQYSRIYNTNDWSSAVLEYRATPFGAQFVVANTERHNSVLNGDDSLSYAGTDQSVSQVLTIFGRVLTVDEAEEVVAKNESQMKRRGKIESEITSPWIQSKEMANDLKDWLVDNFSEGNEDISIEVFGNPLIEVGDIVNVNYPEKHINGDFFVLSTKNSFDEGLTTSLSLRRRNS